ncbi:hypothetical protein [Micromonospora okii]|uniref:hypothetical protein n=1 Tax=Micromonospora okii TaxID=1182970 RepID=UPI001E4B37D1|nr:hypothetical protein [Micromonospora okii]
MPVPVPPPLSRRPSRPHQPMRPAWLCRSCAAPWPCAPARLDLAFAYRGNSVTLALYLTASMQQAMDDTYRLGGDPDFAALHARFLGWLSLARRDPPRDRPPRDPPGARPR